MRNDVKIKIFVSYSHLDEEWRDKLPGHLSFLKQYGDMIEIWHDRKISGGSEWKGMIDSALYEANIILLLISSHFLASGYCYDIEFSEALKRHENLEAIVIPVIIRDVHWQWRQNGHTIGLGDLKALPTDGKAVSDIGYWKNEDKAFTNIAIGIDTVVKELTKPPSPNTKNLTQAQKVAAKFFAQSVRGRSLSSPQDYIESDLSNRVYIALSNLNYREQKDTFRQFLDSGQHIGAFLLHGGYECGQDWIFNLLLRMNPDLTSHLSTSVRIPFVFTQKGFGRSIEDLWDELAIKTGKSTTKPDGIVDAIYTLWQTQTVLLILRGVEAVEETYVRNFLESFWYPLVKKALADSALPANYCMLFFIDNQGRRWQFARCLDSMWEPSTPIDLGKLTKFSSTELKRWRPGEAGRLSPSITIDNILENSDNGLPELVLKNICRLSGDNWRKRLALWTLY